MVLRNGAHFEGIPSANNALAAETVMAERRFIERREEAEVTVIDKTVRNKWSWKWTEKLVAGTILGEFIRKLPRAGLAYCLWCRCDVNYGSRGWKAIEHHVYCIKY